MPVLENSRHEIFAREIAKGSSQREAYRSAGYESDNEDAIDASASRLLTDARVSARVQEIQERAAKRAEIDIEKTLLELAKIGFADIRKAVRWGESVAFPSNEGEVIVSHDVALLSSAEIDDATAGAISEVRKTKDGVSIKMHDKRAALVDIGRHLGMFKDKIEMTGKDGGPIETVDSSPLETARRIAFIFEKARRALEGK